MGTCSSLCPGARSGRAEGGGSCCSPGPAARAEPGCLHPGRTFVPLIGPSWYRTSQGRGRSPGARPGQALPRALPMLWGSGSTHISGGPWFPCPQEPGLPGIPRAGPRAPRHGGHMGCCILPKYDSQQDPHPQSLHRCPWPPSVFRPAAPAPQLELHPHPHHTGQCLPPSSLQGLQGPAPRRPPQGLWVSRSPDDLLPLHPSPPPPQSTNGDPCADGGPLCDVPMSLHPALCREGGGRALTQPRLEGEGHGLIHSWGCCVNSTSPSPPRPHPGSLGPQVLVPRALAPGSALL